MKVSVVTLFSAVIAVSFAEAVPASHARRSDLRPRYYFPRAVKRQVTSFANTTVAETTSLSSGDSGVGNILSTLGDVLSGVASAISGETTTAIPASTDALVTDQTTTPPTLETGPFFIPTSTESAIISATDASTSDIFDLTPTTTDLPSTITDAASTGPTDNEGGITLGLSSIFSDPATATSADTTTGADTTTALFPVVTDGASSALSSASDAATSILSVASSLQSVASTAASSDMASISSALSSAASVASSIASDVSSADSVITTSDSGGAATTTTNLADVTSGLLSLISSIEPTNSPSTIGDSFPTVTATDPITVLPTDTTTIPTDTSALPSETAIVSPTDTVIPTDTATVPPTDTVIPTDTATMSPTDIVIPPANNTATATDTGSATATDTGSSTPTDTNTITATDTNTAIATSPPAVGNNATSTTPPITTPTETTTLPPTDTAIQTSAITTSDTSIPTVIPTETSAEIPSASPPVVGNFTTSPVTTSAIPTETTVPVNTVQPTGTDSATALIPQSSIISAPSTVAPPDTTSTSQAVIPTTLPQVIQPQGGVPEAPENSTLIQVGFTYALNYAFVVSSSTAVSQIFAYLPVGVSHGLGLDLDGVVMQYLQPYNTLDSVDYITTLAMAFIPASKVDTLSMALLNPNSELYQNSNPSVATLMGMIDPSIPVLPGSAVAGAGTPVNSANTAATTTDKAKADDGNPGGSSENDSAPIRPSSVGIAVGAVAGAAVYGAAMFLVARRYRKKKAGHQRSSSMQSGQANRPAEQSNLMTGSTRGSYGTRFGGRTSRNSDHSNSTRSGRTYISPPVMAENSLGWN